MDITGKKKKFFYDIVVFKGLAQIHKNPQPALCVLSI